MSNKTAKKPSNGIERRHNRDTNPQGKNCLPLELKRIFNNIPDSIITSKEKTCPGKNFPKNELLERIKVQKKRFIRLYGDPGEGDYRDLLKYLKK